MHSARVPSRERPTRSFSASDTARLREASNRLRRCALHDAKSIRVGGPATVSCTRQSSANDDGCAGARPTAARLQKPHTSKRDERRVKAGRQSMRRSSIRCLHFSGQARQRAAGASACFADVIGLADDEATAIALSREPYVCHLQSVSEQGVVVPGRGGRRTLGTVAACRTGMRKEFRRAPCRSQSPRRIH